LKKYDVFKNIIRKFKRKFKTVFKKCRNDLFICIMQDLKIGNMIIKKRGSVRKFWVVRDFFTEPAEKQIYVKAQSLYFLIK